MRGGGGGGRGWLGERVRVVVAVGVRGWTRSEAEGGGGRRWARGWGIGGCVGGWGGVGWGAVVVVLSCGLGVGGWGRGGGAVGRETTAVVRVVVWGGVGSCSLLLILFFVLY